MTKCMFLISNFFVHFSKCQCVYYILGYNKHRKVSEGLPPFISLLSQNDAAESESACNNVFEIIHEESEKVQNNKFGSRAPQGETKKSIQM